MKVIIGLWVLMYSQLGFSEAEKLTCGNHALAQQLAELIIQEPGQMRSKLVCDEQLIKIAHIRAQQMLEAQKVSHDVNNTTPNQLLRMHDFALPKYYSLFGNQVESLAGGKDIPQEVLSDFLGSSLHRPHVLGEGEPFVAQDKIGVAYVRDPWTLHVDYWVVLIATDTESKNPGPPVKRTVSDTYKKNLLLSLREQENREKDKERKRRQTAYERRIKDQFGPPD